MSNEHPPWVENFQFLASDKLSNEKLREENLYQKLPAREEKRGDLRNTSVYYMKKNNFMRQLKMTR